MKKIIEHIKLYFKEYKIITITLSIVLWVLLIAYIFWAFDSDTQRIKKIIIKQDNLSKQEIEKTVGDLKGINEQLNLLIRDKNLLNKCIKYNKDRMWTIQLYKECNIDKLLIDYKNDTDINKKKNKNILSETDKFLKDVMNLPWCRVTQNEETHLKTWWNVYATDIACERWKPFKVKASNHKEYYVVSSIWTDNIIWDYIVLKHWNRKYLYWHTKSWLSVGDRVEAWDTIWITTMSWITTWIHLHFEYWLNGNNVNSKDVVNPYNYNLKLQRWLIKNDLSRNIAVTTYDLWDVRQNDSTPCIWASWKDLCKMAEQGIQTIALVNTMREKLWIKFWDKIILRNLKTGRDTLVQVEDEMNKRYRISCIKWVEWLCIRADIARYKWKAQLKSWAYRIIKIKTY